MFFVVIAFKWAMLSDTREKITYSETIKLNQMAICNSLHGNQHHLAMFYMQIFQLDDYGRNCSRETALFTFYINVKDTKSSSWAIIRCITIRMLPKNFSYVLPEHNKWAPFSKLCFIPFVVQISIQIYYLLLHIIDVESSFHNFFHDSTINESILLYKMSGALKQLSLTFNYQHIIIFIT